MSTNRSKDRSSLCSFMYVDRRHPPVSCRAQRRIGVRRRSGGLQTGQRDGGERPWCPVSPAFRGGLLFANPELSKGPAFRRRNPASALAYLGQILVQILPPPSTNTSTPTTPIPCAKPYPSPTNRPP